MSNIANRLPELELEDKRYDLHVGAEAPMTYNITLIYPDWGAYRKPFTPAVPLQSPDKIRANLSKIGINL
jgi:hypothetical protein